LLRQGAPFGVDDTDVSKSVKVLWRNVIKTILRLMLNIWVHKSKFCWFETENGVKSQLLGEHVSDSEW